MENNTIKIAYILSNNDKYSTIISLQSLLENNVEEYLDILFIADSTIEKEHIEYCQKMTKKYKNVVKCKIGFIDKQKYKYYINNPKFEFINRLYLFEIPYLTDAEKILFICPQTIVNKSLRELYDTDLTKNSCAGVEYVDNKLIQDTYNFENQKIFSNNILLINSFSKQFVLPFSISLSKLPLRQMLSEIVFFHIPEIPVRSSSRPQK